MTWSSPPRVPSGPATSRRGSIQPLDKSKLPGLDKLDPDIMASLDDLDPDNAHLVPYMWGTTGLGIN